MGFRLKVEGAETIDLGIDSIIAVNYETDTPDDSNARSTDVGSILTVEGKILTATDGDNADDTLKLGLWSLVSAERADCYRKVSLEVIAADQVVRKLHLPNAFVVGYTENYADASGIGTFKLTVKQKRDKNDLVKIEGGYGL